MKYLFSFIIFLCTINILSDAIPSCKVDNDCKNYDIVCQTDCIMPNDAPAGTPCIGKEVFCKNNTCVCDFKTVTKEECKVNIHDIEGNISEDFNKFAFNLFSKVIAEEQVGKNIFISPISISYALSMTYNGADKETKKAFEKTLLATDEKCLNNDIQKKVNKYFSNLIDTLTKVDPKVILTIANSLWAKNGIEFKEDFLKTNKEYYKAEVQSLDFSSAKAPKTINDWVKKNTNNKIEKIVDNSIPPDTIMYLINAIYFKGTWKYKFDAKNTKKGDFNLMDKKTKKVNFMHQIGEFNYFDNNDVQLVELPYGNEKVSMFIFLPATTLADFYKQLNYTNLTEWLSKLQKSEGSVVIPKFKLEYEKKLNDVLKKLGLEIAFNYDKADFSNMLDLKKAGDNVYISDVLHKTFVEVNEEGTEAAAVTSVRMSLAYTPKFNFVANRPFFFVIRDNKTNTILFMGSIAEP